MSTKIIVVIGEHIENLDVATLPADMLQVVVPFPELTHLSRAMLSAPSHPPERRMPRHTSQTAAELSKIVDELDNFEEITTLTIITHSQTVVSLLGERIENKSLAAEDVEVWMYEGDLPTGEDKPKVYSFSDKGYLLDWPIGWFEAA